MYYRLVFYLFPGLFYLEKRMQISNTELFNTENYSKSLWYLITQYLIGQQNFQINVS